LTQCDVTSAQATRDAFYEGNEGNEENINNTQLRLSSHGISSDI